MKNVIKRKITRIITHKDLRFTLYLRWSILLSTLTALFKVTAGLLTNSSWFLFAGLYYSILCVARIFLAHENKELKKSKYKNERFSRAFRDYRYTGFILMILTLPYLLMCVRMFRYGEFENYVLFLLTASAIIALIKLLLSCLGFYNTRDLHSPIISAVKRINLCDALVSIAITQAMLSAFFLRRKIYPLQSLLRRKYRRDQLRPRVYDVQQAPKSKKKITFRAHTIDFFCILLYNYKIFIPYSYFYRKVFEKWTQLSKLQDDFAKSDSSRARPRRRWRTLQELLPSSI